MTSPQNSRSPSDQSTTATTSTDEYTSPSSASDSQLNSTNRNSHLDKLFLTLSVSSYGLGTLFAILLCALPMAAILPILPSIFFGTGFSLMVYRFMGGLNSDDSLAFGNTIKIGGALSSLLGSVIIFNHFMESQAPHNYVSINPDKSRLIVVNDMGEPTELDIKTIRSTTAKLADTINQPTSDSINRFQESCWLGKGICKPKTISVILRVDPSLDSGEAKVCQNNEWLIGLPLMIWNSANTQSMRQVVATPKLCGDQANSSPTVLISRRDAKPLLGSKTSGNGNISITPLKYIADSRIKSK